MYVVHTGEETSQAELVFRLPQQYDERLVEYSTSYERDPRWCYPSILWNHVLSGGFLESFPVSPDYVVQGSMVPFADDDRPDLRALRGPKLCPRVHDVAASTTHQRGDASRRAKPRRKPHHRQ